jgi:hypothetical protein
LVERIRCDRRSSADDIDRGPGCNRSGLPWRQADGTRASDTVLRDHPAPAIHRRRRMPLFTAAGEPVDRSRHCA